MSKSTIQNPHDKLFRSSMRHPEVAHEFLTMHLPAAIINKIDLKSIVVCSSTFIDEELKLTESDVLLQCTIDGEKGYMPVIFQFDFLYFHKYLNEGREYTLNFYH
jgi:predicted transposase/invertase (TIGR01784 family)